MIRKIFVLMISFLLCNYTFGDQECKVQHISKEAFLASYENMCYFQLGKESEIINYANKAEEYGLVGRYLKILVLAEKRGSVEAKFMLGRYFYENSKFEELEEQRLYKLAKGITKISISAEKGLEKAKEYYLENICNSKQIKSLSTEPLCN
jgi:hypothetical protein